MLGSSPTQFLFSLWECRSSPKRFWADSGKRTSSLIGYHQEVDWSWLNCAGKRATHWGNHYDPSACSRTRARPLFSPSTHLSMCASDSVHIFELLIVPEMLIMKACTFGPIILLKHFVGYIHTLVFHHFHISLIPAANEFVTRPFALLLRILLVCLLYS